MWKAGQLVPGVLATLKVSLGEEWACSLSLGRQLYAR